MADNVVSRPNSLRAGRVSRAENPNPEVQKSADNEYLERKPHDEKGEANQPAE